MGDNHHNGTPADGAETVVCNVRNLTDEIDAIIGTQETWDLDDRGFPTPEELVTSMTNHIPYGVDIVMAYIRAVQGMRSGIYWSVSHDTMAGHVREVDTTRKRYRNLIADWRGQFGK